MITKRFVFRWDGWAAWLRKPWPLWLNDGPYPYGPRWSGSTYRWRLFVGPLYIMRKGPSWSPDQ